MADTNLQDDTYSEEETVARREAALKRAFATPHKPHKASKVKGDESQSK
jgi:hypothetical protein